MKKLAKGVSVLCMTTMLIGSATGCGMTGEKSGKDESQELTIWNTEALSPGLQNNAIAEKIEEETGIKINIIQGDNQKFKTLMAAGDLPDIIYSNYTGQNVTLNELINSGQIITLDDLIEENAPNIVENYADVLEYSKQFLSNGTGDLYFLPCNIYKKDEENPAISQMGSYVGYMVRWDAYKKLGCPQIENEDQFLDVLEKMQQQNGETEDGQKVYALSGWTDWGIWPFYLPYIFGQGYQDLPNDILLNLEDGTAESTYASDVFWDALRFNNKAYRRGLYDPDAFIMKYADYTAKYQAGAMLTVYSNWDAISANQTLNSSGKGELGYETVPCGLPYINGVYAADAPYGYGSDYAIGITTNCKNPELALKLLNFTYSEEGSRLLWSGPEGEYWNYDDNEVPKFTEDFLEKRAAGDKNLATGAYGKLAGLHNIQILSDGYPSDLLKSDEQISELSVPVDNDFCQYYGEKYGEEFKFPGQAVAAMTEEGQALTSTEYWLFQTLIEAPSQEEQAVLAKVDQYMQNEVVKLIMCETEEEFNQEMETAKQQISDLGYGDVVKSQNEKIQTAIEEAENMK